ncbi:hypothetical protein DLJ47_01830 [Micromonospora sp. S4605]|uniref:hypothetical protein n=1 Tax=Micromonospora sp. S4605 TaxID=1420897 RepID=UPI000D6FD12F|nr:hypothetical protein [Micromonospora sp. S4605]PWU57672.1 hypothetical protein DLJ47_01830 [Micromonospora sp. S4605]
MNVKINDLLANVKQKVGADYAELVVENALLRAQVAELQAQAARPQDASAAPAPSAPEVVS